MVLQVGLELEAAHDVGGAAFAEDADEDLGRDADVEEGHGEDQADGVAARVRFEEQLVFGG